MPARILAHSSTPHVVGQAWFFAGMAATIPWYQTVLGSATLAVFTFCLQQVPKLLNLEARVRELERARCPFLGADGLARCHDADKPLPTP